MSDNLPFPELWTCCCCGPFLPSLLPSIVFFTRDLGFLCLLTVLTIAVEREERERERERERDGDGVVVVACSSGVRKHTCSSNALVHVTQCVFCCGRKKKRSRTSTKTTMTAAEAMKLVRIWTPMD